MDDQEDKNNAADTLPDITSRNRRRFIQGSATVAAAITLGGLVPFVHAAPGNRVAILGGGVAGLTAAHELIERGYSVTVYETRALGGKARSISVPNTGVDGRLDLPGEHGFRIVFNFYHHLPDSLRRIPFAENAEGVWDNLVDVPTLLYALPDNHDDVTLNNDTVLPFPVSLDGLPAVITSWLNTLALGLSIPANEFAFFADKFLVFLTSGDKRRYGQWENMSWWDYIGASTRSVNYQNLFGKSLSSLVAARNGFVSTRAAGQSLEAFFYAYARQNNDNPSIGLNRYLDLPTNESWITPWVNYLTAQGVNFNVGTTVTGFNYSTGQIVSAQATDANGATLQIQADWFVLAVPVEHAVPLMNPAMIAADARLGNLVNLTTRWMTGIQFFLLERANITDGLMTFVGTPWSLSGLTQAQFWDVNFPATYGAGDVQDVFSVDICDWTTPGMLYDLPANQCTAQQIADEVLAQVRATLDNGATLLPDSMIKTFVIDPGVSDIGTPNVKNTDALFINTPSSWNIRPDTVTNIRNLFLAGDYVHAYGFDLASMETANETGRRAANAILTVTHNRSTPAALFPRYKQPLLIPAQGADNLTYALGLANVFDLNEPYIPNNSV